MFSTIRVFQKFTTPCYLGAAGLITTTSDLLQKPDVALYTAIVLVVLGLFCLLPHGFVVDRMLKEWLRVKLGDDFSTKPFAYTTLLLAAVIFVSSQMTAKAAEDGQPGYLAEAFPEMRSLQASLGLIREDMLQIHEQQAALKKDTSELVNASSRWLTFEIRADDEMIFNPGPEGHVYVARGGNWLINNETNYMFENIELAISTKDVGTIAREAIGFMKNNDSRWKDNAFVEPYETVKLCVTAKRRERAEWLWEEITYQRQKTGERSNSRYIPVNATGLMSSMSPIKCS